MIWFKILGHTILVGGVAPFLLSLLFFCPFQYAFRPIHPLNIEVEDYGEGLILAFMATIIYSPVHTIVGAASGLLCWSFKANTQPRIFTFILTMASIMLMAGFWGVILEGSRWFVHWMVSGLIVGFVVSIFTHLLWGNS